jgi:hypothetical protein
MALVCEKLCMVGIQDYTMYTPYCPRVMRRISAIYQVAIRGLLGQSHTAFASSSKLFGKRHCGGGIIGRRVWEMG